MDTTTDGVFREVQRSGGRRYQRRPTVRSINRKVNMVMKRLNSSVERKQSDHTIGFGAVVSATPVYQALNGIQLGDEYFRREGSQVALVSLAWRAQLRLANTETNDVIARVVLVWQRKVDGVVPAWTDVFRDNDINSMLNTQGENRGNFQILYDKTVVMDPASKSTVHWKQFVDLKGKKTAYHGDTSAVADITSGFLFLIFRTAYNGVTCSIDGKARLRYTDM